MTALLRYEYVVIIVKYVHLTICCITHHAIVMYFVGFIHAFVSFLFCYLSLAPHVTFLCAPLCHVLCSDGWVTMVSSTAPQSRAVFPKSIITLS